MKSTDILKPYAALVVDEDDMARQFLVSMLKGFGMQSVYDTASNRRALELIAGGRVDVVFMDRYLEESEPFGLLSDIRWSKDFPRRNIPVVVCTGYTKVDEIFEARDNGADEIIAKPFDLRQGLQKLASAIFETRPFVDAKGYVGPCRRRRRSKWDGDDRRRAGNKDLGQGDIDKIMGIDGKSSGGR